MDFEQDSCRSSKENNDYFPLVILAKSGANGDFWHQWLWPVPGALILPW